MKKTIAFLGAGIMGSGMIKNLQKAGYNLRIYNRTASKARKLLTKHTRMFSTPAETAKGADIIISSLYNDQASQEVWFGENGIIRTAKPGAIAIETSTLSIDYIDRWAKKIAKHKLIPLDSPVTGSKSGAENATLSILIGGDPKVIEKLSDVFDSISCQLFHFGPVGSGMRFKLAYNLLGATILAAFVEALSLIENFGLDITEVIKMFGENKQAWSQAVAESKGPAIIANKHDDVSCSLDTLLKDVDYALKSAQKHDLKLPSSEGMHSSMKKAHKQGLGNLDMSALAKLFLNINGSPKNKN